MRSVLQVRCSTPHHLISNGSVPLSHLKWLPEGSTEGYFGQWFPILPPPNLAGGIPEPHNSGKGVLFRHCEKVPNLRFIHGKDARSDIGFPCGELHLRQGSPGIDLVERILGIGEDGYREVCIRDPATRRAQVTEGLQVITIVNQDEPSVLKVHAARGEPSGIEDRSLNFRVDGFGGVILDVESGLDSSGNVHASQFLKALIRSSARVDGRHAVWDRIAAGGSTWP